MVATPPNNGASGTTLIPEEGLGQLPKPVECLGQLPRPVECLGPLTLPRSTPPGSGTAELQLPTVEYVVIEVKYYPSN